MYTQFQFNWNVNNFYVQPIYEKMEKEWQYKQHLWVSLVYTV
jgi:hypothetical protein